MPRKKPNKTALKTKADTLFSKVVRSIGYCVRCGKTESLQCSHRVSRRYLATRWDFDNADCLDAGCHFFFTTHPLEFEKWLTEKMGQAAYDALKRKALGTYKPDYEEIVDRLKKAA